MQWSVEPNDVFPKWPYNVLSVGPGEPLLPDFVEYWKRILSDGASLTIGNRFSLMVSILPRMIEKDGTGETTANYQSSLKHQSEGIGVYVLRTEQFTLLEKEGEDDDDYARRELPWLLERYGVLKKALADPEVQPLLALLNSTQPLEINLATSNGWFHLQPDKAQFGPLPQDDQLLLTGQSPRPDDPLANLTAGVLDVAWMRLVNEFTSALIQYTPPHFKNIRCKVTEGLEQGKRALFYEIECPEFPDDGTTVPGERLHRAATSLVQHVSAERGTFPGVRICVNEQPDGTWLHSVEFLDKG